MVETRNMATLPSEAPGPPEHSAGQKISLGKLRHAFHGLIAGALLSVLSTAQAQNLPKPDVEHVKGGKSGTLVIAGGGPAQDIEDYFQNEAGGDTAKIFVVKSASDIADDPAFDMHYFFKPSNPPPFLKPLHTRSRTQADDEAFSRCLQEATGVWFAGGKQWNLDVYVGSRVETELRKLLERGGAIGGTSAGAAVMSKLMIRKGNPPEIGAGFGFVEEAIIDQHFRRDGRKERLSLSLQNNPDLFGIGLHEKTAIVVREKIAEVIGHDSVELLPPPSKGGEVRILQAGDRFDLRTGAIERKTNNAGSANVLVP